MSETDPKAVVDKRADVGLRPPATPAAGPPARKAGRLTREGMLQVVRSGGSFAWNAKHPDGSDASRMIVNEQDVPSDAEIAQQSGDTEGADKARSANEAEIKRLQAENAALRGVQARPATASASVPVK